MQMTTALLCHLFLTCFHSTSNLHHHVKTEHQARALVLDDDGAARRRRKEKKMRQQHYAAAAAARRISRPAPGAALKPRGIVLGVRHHRQANDDNHNGTGHVYRALAWGPTALQQQQHCGLSESLASSANGTAAASTTHHHSYHANHYHHERTCQRSREWVAQEFERSVQKHVDRRGREATKPRPSPDHPRGPPSHACS